MEISFIIPHIEALIFASEKPLSKIELEEFINTALGNISASICGIINEISIPQTPNGAL